MILVGQYDSPYVRRVAITMHLLGVTFERNTLSIFRDIERVRTINPTLRIPALILDDGELLTDSNAILDWLDEQAGPGRALMPRAGADRRRCWRLIALAVTANDKGMAITYERRLRPPEKIHEPVIARCLGQLEAALATLDREPARPWLLGDRLTQADVTVGAMLSYVRSVVPEAAPPGRWPALDRLSAACEAQPAFQACVPSADERPPGG